MAIDRLALRARAERARARSQTFDHALAWIERDAAIGGGMLAGALAYRLFLFVLPLSFFLVAVLGPIADALGSDPQELGADAGLAGLVTNEVGSTASGSSNWWVVLTSLVALVYVTWLLYKAVAITHALAWGRSAASVKLTPGGLAVFGAALLAQLALLVGVAAGRHQSPGGGLAALAVFVLGVAAIWLAVSLVLSHASERWSDLVPGALFYAIGMLGVQVFATYFLDRVLESKTSTYGVLGTAAAILLGAFLLGRIVVASASLNAALFDRRRPA